VSLLRLPAAFFDEVPHLADTVGMAISHVQLFSVPVSDQDVARDFYVDALGFELVSDTEMGPGMRWVQVRPPGSTTSLTLVTWFSTMPAGCLKGTVLESDALEHDIADLRAKGLTIGDIESAPWGRWVSFDDPDGNGIVLQETTGP
jgi:catechol 2,3-dioxygenase-like lactoylglutathione lyase family enzyme